MVGSDIEVCVNSKLSDAKSAVAMAISSQSTTQSAMAMSIPVAPPLPWDCTCICHISSEGSVVSRSQASQFSDYATT